MAPTFTRRLNRIVPALGVQGFRSFGMTVTRRVRATCAEVDCEQSRAGWAVNVLAGSDDERLIEQACDGTVDGLRRMPATRDVVGNSIMYWFPPGQPCFRAASHLVPWDSRFYHRDGDWRGNPSGLVVAHKDARSWVDEFGEHQLRLVEQRQRYGAE